MFEKLNVKGRTKSPKGTVEHPGKNVRAKAELSRAILDTGWSVIEGFVRYKAPCLVEVNPRNTSRECFKCGHVAKESRKKKRFRCMACGHADHADAGAAKNIRRRGLALLHGEERSPPGTPKTREMDRRMAA